MCSPAAAPRLTVAWGCLASCRCPPFTLRLSPSPVCRLSLGICFRSFCFFRSCLVSQAPTDTKHKGLDIFSNNFPFPWVTGGWVKGPGSRHVSVKCSSREWQCPGKGKLLLKISRPLCFVSQAPTDTKHKGLDIFSNNFPFPWVTGGWVKGPGSRHVSVKCSSREWQCPGNQENTAPKFRGMFAQNLFSN